MASFLGRRTYIQQRRNDLLLLSFLVIGTLLQSSLAKPGGPNLRHVGRAQSEPSKPRNERLLSSMSDSISSESGSAPSWSDSNSRWSGSDRSSRGASTFSPRSDSLGSSRDRSQRGKSRMVMGKMGKASESNARDESRMSTGKTGKSRRSRRSRGNTNTFAPTQDGFSGSDSDSRSRSQMSSKSMMGMMMSRSSASTKATQAPTMEEGNGDSEDGNEGEEDPSTRTEPPINVPEEEDGNQDATVGPTENEESPTDAPNWEEEDQGDELTEAPSFDSTNGEEMEDAFVTNSPTTGPVQEEDPNELPVATVSPQEEEGEPTVTDSPLSDTPREDEDPSDAPSETELPNVEEDDEEQGPALPLPAPPRGEENLTVAPSVTDPPTGEGDDEEDSTLLPSIPPQEEENLTEPPSGSDTPNNEEDNVGDNGEDEELTAAPSAMDPQNEEGDNEDGVDKEEDDTEAPSVTDATNGKEDNERGDGEEEGDVTETPSVNDPTNEGDDSEQGADEEENVTEAPSTPDSPNGKEDNEGEGGEEEITGAPSATEPPNEEDVNEEENDIEDGGGHEEDSDTTGAPATDPQEEKDNPILETPVTTSPVLPGENEASELTIPPDADCTDNQQSLNINIDLQIEYPSNKFAACVGDDDARIAAAISDAMNDNFATTVKDWDGEAFFGEFEFGVAQGINNVNQNARRMLRRTIPAKRSLQDTEGNCPTDRLLDCATDLCRWGCLPAVTTDCGTSAFTNWVNLGEDIKASLTALNIECLGIADRLDVIVLIDDPEASGEVTRAFAKVLDNSILTSSETGAATQDDSPFRTYRLKSELKFTFFEGKGAEPNKEEIEELVEVTRQFFTDVFSEQDYDNGSFVMFDMEQVIPLYRGNENANESLSDHFELDFIAVVVLNKDSSKSLRDVAKKMSGSDFDQYIADYVWHAEPFERNEFYKTHSVFFKAIGHGN